MFLTPDELRELTGYRLPGKQIAWLRRYGWRYAVNAAGHPRVAREYFLLRLAKQDGATPDNLIRPNFAAVR